MKIASKLKQIPGNFPIDRAGPGNRKVSGAIFAEVSPTPIDNASLIAVSQPALDLLEISLEESQTPEFLQIFSGNYKIPGTLAHCYCGFQFGIFAGQLGDGAACLLGAHRGWEVGLKGSGLTPFSRQGDGRKVLRSSVREFLASEAMHALGLPSTRAASLVVGSSRVWRDLNYDGHPRLERCAVISRVARSFFRFGSFEIARPGGPSESRPEVAIELVRHVKRQYYGDCSLEEFMKQVTVRTAELVAHWQSIGFCHGVLNTDNMSILGDTIDYGPFAFMEYYNQDLVANTSDRTGMYAFNRQPFICRKNCLILADTLQRLFGHTELLSDIVVSNFQVAFESKYRQLMRRKLRLGAWVGEDDADELINRVLELMEESHADFTTTFYLLGKANGSASEILGVCAPEEIRPKQKRFNGAWDRDGCLRAWEELLKDLRPLQDEGTMNTNPRFILRNYEIQRAIDQAEVDDFSGVHRLLGAALNPFDPETPDELTHPQPPTESVCLSCSS